MVNAKVYPTYGEAEQGILNRETSQALTVIQLTTDELLETPELYEYQVIWMGHYDGGGADQINTDWIHGAATREACDKYAKSECARLNAVAA